MPDFRVQLGRQLRRAAERRWRERRRAPSIGLVAATAGAAVAIAIAVAVVLSVHPPGATQPAAPRVGIPAALPARGCSPARTLLGTHTPQSLRDMLGVLRRPQREPDGLPVLNAPGGGAGDEGWLPLASLAFQGVRLVHEGPNVWIVPSRDLRPLGEKALAAPCPAAPAGPAPARPGACLVTGFAGGPLAWRCFVTKDIEEGRAAMRLRGGRVVALMPDGVASVSGAPARSNLAVLPPGSRRLVPVPRARRVGPGVYSSLALRSRSCPYDALALPPGARGAAAAAVRGAIHALVPHGIDPAGAIVRGYSSAGVRGGLARGLCGIRARERSVVVTARFPRVTFSAALSQATYYVSREPRGWLVWGYGPG